MLAVNYTNLRGDMKTYMDTVSDDCETLFITRKGEGRNLVMMSEAAYNNLLENVHLMSDSANYSWLLESKRQLEEGRVRRTAELDD